MEADQREGGKRKWQALAAVAIVVVIVAAAALGYSALSSSSSSAQSSAAAYDMSPGTLGGLPAASEIKNCPIADADAVSMKLGDVLDGKPMVLNVWASWCPYCVDEMADYQRLYDEYNDRVRFVMADAVQGDAQEAILASDFLRDGGYTLPLYYDVDGSLSALFGVRVLPTTIILSSDGEPLLYRTGAIQYDNMKATLDTLLG